MLDDIIGQVENVKAELLNTFNCCSSSWIRASYASTVSLCCGGGVSVILIKKNEDSCICSSYAYQNSETAKSEEKLIEKKDENVDMQTLSADCMAVASDILAQKPVNHLDPLDHLWNLEKITLRMLLLPLCLFGTLPQFRSIVPASLYQASLINHPCKTLKLSTLSLSEPRFSL
ncbi:hypothetical protein POM88_021665 [Heracleum sosnowskyi]|uniref:Uncharacterized protein n=1 Tax=Heracleum sosnowskyi TaxID=360622 RepID=A0AAD8IDW6_9APIA|nr:hypothetical protein POM88_021665 [Heracleum sosnowskyi]